MQEESQPQTERGTAQDHHESFIALGKATPAVRGDEAVARSTVTAEARSLMVTIVTVAGNLHGIAGESGAAAEIHVFGNRLEPFWKTSELMPKGTRYPQARTDDHGNMTAKRIMVGDRIIKGVKQTATVYQFVGFPVILRQRKYALWRLLQGAFI